MLTPRERYQSDPAFHALVETFLKMLTVYTPSEIRDAAMLAQILYEEQCKRVQFLDWDHER